MGSLVINFGLAKAPADYQKYINDVLRPFLDEFCMAYVLIFSEMLEDTRSTSTRYLRHWLQP